MKKTVIVFFVLLVVGIVAAVCLFPQQESILVPESSGESSFILSEPSEQDEESVPSEEIFEPVSVRLKAAGDNLIHNSIYEQALARGGDRYDFTYAYEKIESLIQEADIATINQETVISPDFPPSSYPCFNSPTELLECMVNLGFDVFNQANNHCLDKGEQGIISALQYYQNFPEVLVTGVYLNEEDYQNIRTYTHDGITFSFLGLTELTNGLYLPQGSDVIIVQGEDEAMLKERIAAAKEISDVVVMNIHWGNEYTNVPTDRQRYLAQFLADCGVDLIIGHHPHVIQPVEWIQAEDGRKVLCAFSLGNFISAQDRWPRMLGGILDVTFEQTEKDGEVTIKSATFVPIVTHYDAGFTNNRLYPLSEYTEELAQSHGVQRYSSFSLSDLYQLLNEVIGPEFLPEEMVSSGS